MKIPLLTLVCLATLGVAASAITPETEAFLTSIGITDKSEPNLEQAEIADSDGLIKTTYSGDEVEYSLESLVKEKKKNGVRSFVTTRVFIRKLKADYKNTQVPKSNYYEALYLTPDERKIVGRKMAEGISRRR